MTRRFPAGQTCKMGVEITAAIHRALRIHAVHTDRTMIELMDRACRGYLDWLDNGGIPDVRLFAVQPMRIRISILPPTSRRLIATALRHRTTAGVLLRDAVARFCALEHIDLDLSRRDPRHLRPTDASPGDAP